jgi:putative toxin-antitoxin system antitoxin component (TIGR02293 family)
MVISPPQPIPFKRAEKVAKVLGLSDPQLAALLVISPKTLERRRIARKLEPNEGLRIELWERAIEEAQGVLGSERGLSWLNHPSAFFGLQTPLQQLTNIAGLERVKESLYRAALGMF